MTEKSKFEEKLLEIAVHGMIASSIALGTRLQLFEALSKVASEEHPATAAEVAEASGCKERYVKEWLSVMATGDIIEVNEDEKFWIKKENVEHLISGSSITFSSFLPVLTKGFETLTEVFKKNGPLGLNYSDFSGFYDMMAACSEVLHKKHLISDFIPAVDPDLKKHLEDGGMMCLDVGCGKGFHAAFLAQHFPKSNFTGIDLSSEAVLKAKQQRKDNGEAFENLTFIEMNAAHMDSDWTGKFDVVTIFDSCHDQTRPDLCLKEIYRVLKNGGVFGMLEVKGSSNVYTDRKEWGLFAAQMYGCSMFHCLPVGSNSPDALGLGAMWGQKRAVKLLEEAGFTDIKIIPTPHFLINVLYVCKK